ncbi:MAG: prephenate dehydrogenase [Peptococcaceae bacterium]|jgi:prephenate dehydrogenase|nr:prephenate dehydrogenase [Peptococcaceae bacterium]
MIEPDFKKMEITIVGLGLIGGSLAKALAKLKPRKIWAVDKDEQVIRKAQELGIIERGFTNGHLPLRSSDLVILALYPGATVDFVKQYLEDFKPGALLTDTAGIKQEVVNAIQDFLRPDLDFIGGHPLAGKEHSGFDFSAADIFNGANYILTPVAQNKADNVEMLKAIIKKIGCKEPVQMSPEEHDNIIALTSQLPHVIAASLVNSSQVDNIEYLCGGSFRDATRVAPMNVQLWCELLLKNKQNVLTQIDAFVDNISKIKEAIANENQPALAEILKRAGKSAKVIN